jgi:hypothetical protein
MMYAVMAQAEKAIARGISSGPRYVERGYRPRQKAHLSF